MSVSLILLLTQAIDGGDQLPQVQPDSSETIDDAEPLPYVYSSPLRADVIEAIGCLVDNDPTAQNVVASIRDAPELIVQLFDYDEECTEAPTAADDTASDGSQYRRRRADAATNNSNDGSAASHRVRQRLVELATMQAVARLVTGHSELRAGFFAAGVTSWLIMVMLRPGGDVLMIEAAVDAILRLVDGTADAQPTFITGPDERRADRRIRSFPGSSPAKSAAADNTDDVVAALLDVATRPPGQIHQRRMQARENVS